MKKKFIALLTLLTLLFTLVGCKSEDTTTSISDSQFKFNTIMTITLYGYNDTAIFNDIWAEIDRMEQSFSANIESSDVTKFNQNPSTEPIPMPEEIVMMVDHAKPYSDKTSGGFDLTIEPVVQLWGISTDHPRVPAQAELDAALLHVNYQNVIADTKNNTLQKLDPNVHIDLGGIAKGYTADFLKAFIAEKGIDRAIINLGGNIYAVGSKAKDTPWNVGIQNPFEPNGDVVGILKTSDKSVVTSGSYERNFEQDGKFYHHILNTETGYPVENELISVSIVSDKSLDGDILSTSTFSLGLDEGRALIDSLDNMAAIFITKDKSIYFAGDKELLSGFELNQPDFQIKE